MEDEEGIGIKIIIKLEEEDVEGKEEKIIEKSEKERLVVGEGIGNEVKKGKGMKGEKKKGKGGKDVEMKGEIRGKDRMMKDNMKERKWEIIIELIVVEGDIEGERIEK